MFIILIVVLLLLILFSVGVYYLVAGILNLVKGKEKVKSIIAIIFGTLITTIYTNAIIISVFNKCIYFAIK